jgi:hypothetical protein
MRVAARITNRSPWRRTEARKARQRKGVSSFWRSQRVGPAEETESLSGSLREFSLGALLIKLNPTNVDSGNEE